MSLVSSLHPLSIPLFPTLLAYCLLPSFAALLGSFLPSLHSSLPASSLLSFFLSFPLPFFSFYSFLSSLFFSFLCSFLLSFLYLFPPFLSPDSSCLSFFYNFSWFPSFNLTFQPSLVSFSLPSSVPSFPSSFTFPLALASSLHLLISFISSPFISFFLLS